MNIGFCLISTSPPPQDLSLSAGVARDKGLAFGARKVFQAYIDLRSKSNGKNDASRHSVMVTHDLHGNEVVVGLYWGASLANGEWISRDLLTVYAR